MCLSIYHNQCKEERDASAVFILMFIFTVFMRGVTFLQTQDRTMHSVGN